MPAEQARRLAGDRGVAYVEQDRRFAAAEPSTAEPSTAELSTAEPSAAELSTASAGGSANPPVPPDGFFHQSPVPSWGLDRIDQRSRLLDNDFHYALTGAGVHGYVISTGVLTAHQNFHGRAQDGWDFVDGDAVAQDCFGEGTYIAGVFAGAETYAVAKHALPVAVRVLDCAGEGTTAQIVAGIDWVSQNAIRPAVANVGFVVLAVDQLIDDAVAGSIASGIPYVVSAGGADVDACTVSPARVPEAITVSATVENDGRRTFADFGPCVDLFAPGQNIGTLSATNPNGSVTRHGVRLAAAHVAGVAAMVLELAPLCRPQDLADQLVNDATTGVVGQPGPGSPNRLVHVWLDTTPIM
jgi:subtilisin family serine protease